MAENGGSVGVCLLSPSIGIDWTGGENVGDMCVSVADPGTVDLYCRSGMIIAGGALLM